MAVAEFRRSGPPRAGMRPWLLHRDQCDETRLPRSAAFHLESGNHTHRGTVRTLNPKNAMAPNDTWGRILARRMSWSC
jgi:hypothetical protein